ncbi:MAG: indolepyruvate ferredoxin oxidoreductase subunit alpha [Candidatus Heimdallarchaeota archaeon]|nr:indolepyruvate ferredoxin oxidoreductase subunit alpha [Candidatus Heimdallarchaeota archaeon]
MLENQIKRTRKSIKDHETTDTLTLLGNEAIAYGLFDGGVKYVAAYPGTPSTEIMETLNKNFSSISGNWSANEVVATEEAAGAAITGTDSAVITKSVGLNVAMDPIMTLALAGVNAAMVIIVADDPGMHSSQNEQDNRIIARFADLPMYEPSNIQECYDFTREAILLSRKFSIPVFVRSVTRISHSLGVLKRYPPKILEPIKYERNPKRFVSIPGNARANKSRMLGLRQELALHLAELKPYDEYVMGENPEYLVVTSGSSFNYTVEAIEYFNLPAHVLKLNMVYPFPHIRFLELCKQIPKVLVIEELEPFIEILINHYLADTEIETEVIGKRSGLTSEEGELTTEKLLDWMGTVLNLEYTPHRKIELEMVDLLRMRPPVLCAGCPHRSTYVLMDKELRRANPIYCNDIGCYSLGVLPPHDKADSLICMGASIPMATAVSKTKDNNLGVAIIGDSTFWHSGVPGLANAIWKKANILILVMDNSTTAMTGAQPTPSSEDLVNLDIAKTASAMGAWTRIIDPMKFKESREVFKEALKVEGVRVIVSKSPCALNVSREYKVESKPVPLMEVDEELCIACGRCIDPIGCPALSKDEKGIAHIDPILCTGCGYCAEHCPKNAIHFVERRGM